MEAARAYYNDIDPAAVAVLRHLIADGVIAPGEVDTRSIKEVQPYDLRGFTQCHFFAGGGLWSVAARMAGWPDDRPLWTGSCPCQPFSAAGKGLGTDDPRHLWPDFFRLIRACRPPVVMGEQVAGAAGYGWLDGVRADLAGENYASRGVDIPACAVDAPHQRNRLYWIAASGHVGDGLVEGLEGYARHGDGDGRPEADRSTAEADGAGAAGEMGNGRGTSAGRHAGTISGSQREGPGERREPWDFTDGLRVADDRNGLHAKADGAGAAGTLGHGAGRSRPGFGESEAHYGEAWRREPRGPDGRNGSAWSDAEWIVCHDGKARRAKSGLRLLVDGLPGRVDLWRVGGNAIVPVLAAEVIGAFLDAEEDLRAAA